VVVEVPVGALVAGVVLVDVVVDVVDVVVDVGVVVVDVVEDVVVVGAGAGAGDGDGDGVKMSCTLVPPPPLPKTAESGWPEISSMAVTNMSAITKTMAAVPAIVFRLNVGGVGRPPGRPGPGGAAGCVGTVAASIRSVAGAADVAGAEAAAEVSWRSVSPSGAADAGGERSSDESTSPLTTVEPNLRNRVEESGARTTTCLTASWPRSIDWATSAVANVAAADPMATPMTVPFTPKVDAMTAAMTAPTVEARI
jgi:hypothetical protein